MRLPLILITFCHIFIFANGPTTPPNYAPDPWLTGPLIAPSGQVVPLGTFEIEPFIYFSTVTGIYNQNWKSISDQNNFFSINTQLYLYAGLTPWLDISIMPQFFYNTTANQSCVKFGDLSVALDFQLLDPGYTPYFPGIKFTLKETFPTGSYQNLDPKKLLTDQSGQGTYATTFNLVFYKIYHLGDTHFLSTTYSAAYTINTPVKVHGLTTYGGAPGITGTLLPGDIFQAVISFEFSISRHIAFAIDNVYIHVNRDHFFNAPSELQFNTSRASIVPVSAHSSEQISFAPGIEYNWSQNLGLCVGCWFTAWGRNSPIFRTAIIDLVYNF